MSHFDDRNRGIISKNNRKTKDTHPDITGSINVDGVDYFIDGWHKRRNDGSGTFYSLSVKRKDKQSDSGPSQGSRVSPQQVDPDDSIPFAPEWR